MRKAVALTVLILLLSPIGGYAQDSRMALEAVARAMGATGLKSIEYMGAGSSYAVGQSTAPGQPWPRFVMQVYTRSVNYETASLREDAVRQRVDPQPRGGGLPAMGQARQIFVVSGDRAWNVAGDTATPTPVALAERQFQLWSTPHGVIRAALANNATMQGRTISFAVPGRSRVTATVDAQNLIEKVEGVIPHPVLGDLPVEVSYADYRDFYGVKFPVTIRQSAGGFLSLVMTVYWVRPNATVDITVPAAVRAATNPYARVTSQKVADGVWYLTGGSHHSVVIEMKDHLIVAESPLNEERALAVIAEARALVPGKPIRFAVASHHHFDHAGGLRTIAAEGTTVIGHENNRAFFERALAAPATVSPDRMAKASQKPTVEGVRDRRTLTDGTRSVDIYPIAGNLHADDLLMVYLPKEKLLIQADTYTPGPPNAPAPSVVNPNSVNLADTIAKLGLAVDQLLPLHGRPVPLAELHKTIGRAR
jgi:glyoxylase-like metal-dependent hydrolase (beta-lactamase superfamily II)